MKALVLAEKPSVARDIARVLKCGKNNNGAIEGPSYIVTWGLGHLVTLADPEDYDKKYKEWKMEDLPMMPEPFKLEVIKQTAKQYQAVKAQLFRKDVDQVIIATDAGREGELVARLILKKAGCKKPVKRLWISSVTDKAIREGFACLRDGREYESLYDAAMCRAEADWLVGINATRALTCKYNAQLSCGRVQTPTLAMIAAREQEIKSFSPKPYYGLKAVWKPKDGAALSLTWQEAQSKSFRSFDRNRTEQILKKLQGRGERPGVGQGEKPGVGQGEQLGVGQREWQGNGHEEGARNGQGERPGVGQGERLGYGQEERQGARREKSDKGVGVVTEVRRSPKKTQAPLLYDLTELQREANRRFDLSAKDTLNIMQRLYENHKVLTYPRTDSRYLSSDILPTIKERLKACGTGPYKKLAAQLLHQPLPAKPFFVDDKKVSDHHAIIPTEQYVQLDHMTIDERRIYDLVVRRFLAVLMPPYQYEQMALTVDVGGERFLAHGAVVKDIGWKAAYGEDGAADGGAGQAGSWDEDAEWDGRADADREHQEAGAAESEGRTIKSQQLPPIKVGDRLEGLTFAMTEGKTRPPSPFNEATLLSAMENPIAYLETKDKAMARTLGETGGLGTVATRADIIEKLFSSFLVEKRGKEIFLTSKGRQLLSLVPEDLKKPELTAQWEMRLSMIAKGGLKRDAFMQDIKDYSRELIGQIERGEGTFRHDNLTNTRCPVCGKRMLLVKGKNSQMLVCQDRACGHRETISRTSNARCPVCHKRMELRGKGDGQIFVCACGHKEKLTAFQERRKREGAGVSKRDVARYLERQKKEGEEPVNNAFAKALAQIKLEE